MSCPFPLVLVEWKDHWDSASWKSLEDIEHIPELCLTVGWLVKETEEGLTVVSCLDPHDPINKPMGSTQYILKNCITKHKVLRKATTPRKKKQKE